MWHPNSYAWFHGRDAQAAHPNRPVRYSSLILTVVVFLISS